MNGLTLISWIKDVIKFLLRQHQKCVYLFSAKFEENFEFIRVVPPLALSTIKDFHSFARPCSKCSRHLFLGFYFGRLQVLSHITVRFIFKVNNLILCKRRKEQNDAKNCAIGTFPCLDFLQYSWFGSSLLV